MKKWIYRLVLNMILADDNIKLTGKQKGQITGLLYKCI